MPLFRRQEKMDEEERAEEDKKAEEAAEEEAAPEAEEGAPPEAEEEAAPEAEEEAAPEAEEEAAPEAEVESLDLDEEVDEDEEDDEGPSIDDLLEDEVFKDRPHMPGEAPPPMERDAGVDVLAGDDLQLVKMARKVVVIGDPAVGKTSLIKRYVQDVFDDKYLNTIGAKVMKKSLGVNRPETGEIIDLKLILWDIAGQETFKNVKKAYYRGASGAIVVCDVTRSETMENMHKWIENLFDVSGVVPMVLIMNKTDLDTEGQFKLDDVKEEYAPYEAPAFETSAKTGQNVELIFHELGKIISN